jgi:hypothetical protein
MRQHNTTQSISSAFLPVRVSVWAVGVVAVLCICNIYALAGWQRLFQKLLRQPSLCLGLLAGIVLFAFIWHKYLKACAGWRALHTLEHELAHLLAAWSVGGQMLALKVQADGSGSVHWQGKRGHWWVALAPYWLPTPLLLGACLLSLLSNQAALNHTQSGWSWAGFVRALAWGVCICIHVIHTAEETRWQQSDLKQVGWLFASVFLLNAHLFVATLWLLYIVQ